MTSASTPRSTSASGVSSASAPSSRGDLDGALAVVVDERQAPRDRRGRERPSVERADPSHSDHADMQAVVRHRSKRLP